MKTDPFAHYVTDAATGCWVWQGAIHRGYGYVRLGGRAYMAHRAFYEHHRGPISEGLHLDHLCRNKACVNPEHLEPVTPQVNLRRGEHPNFIAWRNDTCTKGHPFAKENTWFDPKRGTRHCRTCRTAAMRRLRARRASAA